MRSSLLAVASAVVVCGITVGACSGDTTDIAVSADQAWTDAAAAFCARVNACSPAFVELIWGDANVCASKFKPQLAGALASAGTSSSPSQYEACAQALPGASCDDVLGRNLPEVCKAKTGTLAHGAACGDGSQCVGGRCNTALRQS